MYQQGFDFGSILFLNQSQRMANFSVSYCYRQLLIRQDLTKCMFVIVFTTKDHTCLGSQINHRMMSTNSKKICIYIGFLTPRQGVIQAKRVGFIYTFWYSLCPPIYQFQSRIEALVSSSLANDYFRRISASFKNLFSVNVT